MANKPNVFPDFCTDIDDDGIGQVTDPVSGQLNAVEPSALGQSVTEGYRRQEEVPRQSLNWFIGLVGKWIRYLSEQSKEYVDYHFFSEMTDTATAPHAISEPRDVNVRGVVVYEDDNNVVVDGTMILGNMSQQSPYTTGETDKSIIIRFKKLYSSTSYGDVLPYNLSIYVRYSAVLGSYYITEDAVGNQNHGILESYIGGLRIILKDESTAKVQESSVDSRFIGVTISGVFEISKELL